MTKQYQNNIKVLFCLPRQYMQVADGGVCDERFS